MRTTMFATRLVWFVCLALIAGTSACSFSAVRAPHVATPTTELDCTSIRPTLDTIGAVIGLGTAGALAYASATASNRNQMGAAYAAIGIGIPAGVVGVTYGASAIYGAHTLSRCRRLEREQRAMRDAGAATSSTSVHVRALVDEAARHAREGRCDRAVAIARQVRTLYPDYYVLVRDESDVLRCIEK